MKDLWLVLSFTFKDLVKRKSFIISNVIIFLIIIIGFNVPNIMKSFTGEDESFGKTKIQIVDNENIYEGNLSELAKIETGYDITILEDKLTIDQVKEKIEKEELENVIYVAKEENNVKIQYITKASGMMSLDPTSVIEILQKVYQNKEIGKLALTPEQTANIYPNFNVETIHVGDSVMGNLGVMMILCLVLFYAIYFYAYQVTASITTEKTSKIIETLVTSTSPRIIVIGKTLGIGLAGILQTVAMVVVAVVSANVFMGPEMIGSMLQAINITPTLAVITLIYYVLGYTLFAFLYALTGSTVSKPEDVQSANGPVAILAVIGFYLAYFTMMNPASELNSFAAMLPISSPFCMPFRAMMGLASMTDVMISIAILIVTIAVIASISIKIYSQAILNYGSKISFKDIIKMYKSKD